MSTLLFPISHRAKAQNLPNLFLKFVLLIAMLWAASAPTTALAAPVQQFLGTDEDEAVLLAYYESDVFEVEDEGEFAISVSFFDDDTFALTIAEADGAVLTVGSGDYETSDEGVSLTITSADGEELEEPEALELVWDADDTLIIPSGDLDLPFDIVLYPVEVEADDTGDDIGDDVEEQLDDADDSEGDTTMAGVYASSVQPYENSPGVVYLLNLLPSGEASLNSDYLDLVAPIFELGTWVDNGDGTLTVEITESLDEVYDDVIIIEFTIGEYSELMLEDFSLYPLEIFDYLAEDDFGDDTGEELGDEESDVFLYIAEIDPTGGDDPVTIYMFLYDDGFVIMTDADETTTLYGEWTLEDDILSVLLTSDDEETFDEPGELVFEFNDEGALVATEYPVDVFGEEAPIFYPSDDEDGGDDVSGTEDDVYFYESDVLPSTDTDGIVISLVLGGEGDALVSTDFMDDEDAYLEYGSWTRDDDGNVIVTVVGSQDEDYDEPYVFTFAEDEDDLSLTLIEESVEIFGDYELVLYRVD